MFCEYLVRRFFLSMLMLASPAVVSAAVVSLNFENIAPYPNNNDVFVQNFYNGGTSSVGTSGPHYGVSFSSPALVICLNTTDTKCSNTSHGGTGIPGSELSGLFFLTSDAITMNVAAGFDTGFSFNYTAINQSGTVDVYDAADGSGNLLASLNLPTTPSSCATEYGAGFCPFFPVGVSFAGVARSVVFSGVGDQIVFDDITFGSAEPGAVPEPSSMALVAIPAAAAFVHRRRVQKQRVPDSRERV